MSYSGNWYYGGQNQGPVAYQTQSNQYNQQAYPQYNQQYNQSYDQQYNQGYQYNQQPQYQPQPPIYQPPTYQQPPQYNNYNNDTQWGSNQYQYDARSTCPPEVQQQQYVPAHIPYAPPTAVQALSTSDMRYQYSDLRGKRKALLVGINYFNGSAPLRGCINDVHNIKDFLIQGYRFTLNNMCILTDDQTDPRSIPTRANIIAGMQWLVAGAQPGDDLFLHYSGHGGPVKDADGDEDDGYDEAIFPVDAEEITSGPGYIVDDLIHDICVKSLPQGCRLTAVFDCCHSGSIMDLPYMYSTKGVLKEPSIFKDTGLGLLNIGAAYVQEDVGGMIVGTAGLLKRFAQAASGHNKKVREAKTSAADVICFSGCKDVQTSMDAQISGQGQGAMSHAFKTALLKHGGNLTYIQLLNAIRQELQEGGYEQKPQLSACHPIDLDYLFTL